MEKVNPYQSPRAQDLDDPSRMFDPVRPFDYRRRMGRTQWLNYLGAAFIFTIFFHVLPPVFALHGSEMEGAVLIGYHVLATLLGGVWVAILTIQRLHDLDKDGRFAWLCVVPGVNGFFGLYLLLMPGTKGSNRYGLPTPQGMSTASVVLLTLIVLAVGGAVVWEGVRRYFM